MSKKARPTPGVEKPRLPAAIYHFLLTVFRGGDERAEMVWRDGVVEDENERAAWSGSSNVNGHHVIVPHHRPNFIFCCRKHTHTEAQYA